MLCKSLLAVVVHAAAGGARAEALALDQAVVEGALATLIDQQASTQALVLELPALAPAAAAGPPPQLSGVGLGLQVGFPTSITLKIGAAQVDGLLFGLGAGFGYGRNFLPWLSLHGEYQLHLATLVRNGTLSLTGYFSPGLWLALFGNGRYGIYDGYLYAPGVPFGLGVRGTFGLSMLFAQAPVELYLELTPTLFVFPGLDPGLGWSLGFRYYF
jgi:hypothetical protein